MSISVRILYFHFITGLWKSSFVADQKGPTESYGVTLSFSKRKILPFRISIFMVINKLLLNTETRYNII